MNYWIGGMSSSFALMCLDLAIPNMEYHNISNKQVRNTSIQEWVDYTIEQFTEHQNVLETSEKLQLSSYLIQCEEKLRLTKFAGSIIT